MSWNKERIIQLLINDNVVLEKAIVAIYNRQTASEQSCGETIHSNGIGFSGAHANLGSYYARWILSGRNLSGKHLLKARVMMTHYAKQLTECMDMIAPNQS